MDKAVIGMELGGSRDAHGVSLCKMGGQCEGAAEGSRDVGVSVDGMGVREPDSVTVGVLNSFTGGCKKYIYLTITVSCQALMILSLKLII